MELTLIRQEIASIRENRDGNIRLYDVRIANALGDVLAALILERIVYFFCHSFQGHDPYTPVYMFQAPCQHKSYRQGESLVEALSIRKLCQLRAALKTIATKLKCPSKKYMRDEVLSHKVAIFDENGLMLNAHYLITYETDAQRVTRYAVNEPLYFDMLKKINEKAWVAPQKPVVPAVVTPTPVKMTREQEINVVLDKYPSLDSTQKAGVLEVFSGYKKEELKNWRGLLHSLCQKALQGELSLPIAQIAPAKPAKLPKAKPKGKRLDSSLKDELMRELQSKATRPEWLAYLCGSQFVQIDNGLVVLVANDFIISHYKKHPDLINTCESVTGLKVVGVRTGNYGSYDCE